MRTRRSLSNWRDIVALVVLFSMALGMRLTYQKESIINIPIRADAQKYFRVAYNLYFHKIYSTASRPLDGESAQNYGSPPGYPLFLYPFIAAGAEESQEQFLNKVTAVQAFLGSLTVLAVYLIARLCFSSGWAFTVGMLTALSPHLVAIDHFLLSETLFTFTITLAALALAFSWRNKHFLLTVLAGALFGFSALVRPVALLLGPFMGFVYVLHGRKLAVSSGSALFTQIICLLFGYALVCSPYVIFKSRMITGSHTARSQYVWQFVLGTDVGLKNFEKNKKDLEILQEKDQLLWDRRFALKVLKERFSEAPFSCLKWYFGGKLFYMWRWDNYYAGDVYQYPMERKGFDVNPQLHAVHTLMRWLHWPLYLLTLSAPVFLVVSRRRGTLKTEYVVLLVPLLMFLYFAGLLTLFVPLPRYAIPVRPLAYMLGVYGLQEIVYIMRCVTRGVCSHRSAPTNGFSSRIGQ